MNTTTASPGRISLILLTALVAFMTGCATPLSQIVSPAPTVGSDASALTVHPRIEQPTEALPTPDAAKAWLADLAPAKAKDGDVDGKDGAGSPATKAPPAEPVVRECPDADERVLLIGDSLSAGLGPHMAKRARACGTKFHQHGVIGSHVTEWVSPSWLKAQLHRAKPTVVMVSLGGNDFVRNDPERVERAIQTFVTTVRESGAELLWISPPTMPFPDKVGARAMWQNAIDGEVNVDWFATETLEIPRSPDRVHPTIPEYAKLSGKLWHWMSTVTQ